MALYVKRTVEPLAGAEVSEEQPRLESDAVQVLTREIGRYMRREIRGRSLLIAGHRGAGKTTAVLDAMDSVLPKPPGRLPRPILVRVHGPDLLLAADAAGGQTGKEKSNSQEPVLPEDEILKKHARLQIVLSLLRALCDEAANCYEECVVSDQEKDDTGKHIDANQELLEAASQFRMELDREPDEIRLRMYWEQARRLAGGILRRGERDEKLSRERQGYWEIVALATAIRVHREIRDYEELKRKDELKHKNGTYQAGETSGSEKRGRDEDAEEHPITTYFTGLLKNSAHILNPLAGLILGVIIVAILLKSDVDLVVALVAGFIAAIGATVILNFASSRGEHYSLVSASTSAALNRMLPVLLERVRTAGLHPVFAVDELDKVDDLPKRMDQLMDGLKHIVADQAFFCFLANREYYEHVAMERRNSPYPKVETYFGEVLYVYHTPAQMHEYLDKLIETDGTSNDDIANKILFIYTALYQSKMHAGVLSRYITSNLKADAKSSSDTITRSQLNVEQPDPKKVPAYLHHLLIQLAVEFFLEDNELKTRLRQSPDSAQQVYDALYYPARRWEDDHTDLNTSLLAFGDYLKERTGADNSRYAETDFRLLRDLMVSVVASLVEPKSLANAIKGRFLETDLHSALCAPAPEKTAQLGFSVVVGGELRKALTDLNFSEDRLRTQAQKFMESKNLKCSDSALLLCDTIEAFELFSNSWEPLLIRDSATTDLYYWKFDRYGRSLDRPVIEKMAERNQLAIRIQTLEDLVRGATAGAAGLGDLATEFHLVEETPSWTDVRTAMDGLQEQSGRSPQIITDYYRMLTENAAILRAGLMLGWLHGKQEHAVKAPLLRGLKSDMFRGLGLDLTHKRSERIKKLQDELANMPQDGSELKPIQKLAEHLALVVVPGKIEDWIDPLRILMAD